MIKKLLYLFVCGSICVSLLTSCQLILFQPLKHPNTKWVSEDGNFVIYISYDERAYGKISKDGTDTIVRADWYHSEVVLILESTENYYYPNDSRPKWDDVRNESAIRDIWYFDCSLFGRSMVINKNEYLEPSAFLSGEKIVLHRERCSADEIVFPTICERPYEYVYLQYKDLLEGNIKERQAIQKKYGKFRTERSDAAFYGIPMINSDTEEYVIQIYFDNSNSVTDVSLIKQYI